MDNRLDNFENSINDALSQHEVTYNPEHWDEMNAMLDNKIANKNYHVEKWAVAGLMLSAIALLIGLSSPEENTTICQKIKNNASTQSSVKANTTINNENIVPKKQQAKQIKTLTAPVKDVTIESTNIEIDLTREKTPTIENNGNGSKEKNPITTNVSNIDEHIASIIISKTTYCLNESIKLATNATNVTWEFGDGFSSTNQTLEHQYEQAGVYTIKLTDSNKKSITKELTVNPIPEVYFDFDKADHFDINQEYKFYADNFESIKTTWSINDKVTHVGKTEVSSSFYKRGIHNVKLTCENQEGCVSFLEKKIDINADYDLLAPKSFSPNGDGTNDYWIPNALKGSDIPFELTIVDRSGKVIFKSNSANNTWNGRRPNGTQAKSFDTFIWTAVFSNTKGEKQTANGSITIVK
jgi:gliding motility-associated-like protein